MSCAYNAGFSGEDGAVCVLCAAGKYRHSNFGYNWARSCGAARTDACPTAQSSSAYGGDRARAVDGNFNALGSGNSCTHTVCALNNW